MLQLLHAPPPTDVLRLRTLAVVRFSAMSLLDLNSDVLATILSFVRPADAMRLALTCHEAHAIAMPRFLSEVVLGSESAPMSGPAQITLFCNYMLADAPARMRHLRVLHIEENAFVVDEERDGRASWVQDFSCAPVLADMLRLALNLRKLYIRDLEQLLGSQPAVADALAPLARLQDVSFHYIGKCTLEMLKHTACRPRRLEFGMWKDGSSRVAGDTASFDTYAPSLQTLNLWQCACLLESLGPAYIGPGVRALGLGGRVPLLSIVSNEFPNVRTIKFAEECSVEEEDPNTHWAALDRVDTSLPAPFFSCTIRRLDLRYVLGDALRRFSATAVVVRTRELIRQATPVVLSCVVAPAMPGDIVDSIADLIPQVKYLELELGPPKRRVQRAARRDIEDGVDNYLPRLAKIPLVGLLVVATAAEAELEGAGGAQAALERIARFAARHITTLEHVGVWLRPDADAPSPTPAWQAAPSWFRVKMRFDERDPVLHALSSEHGEAVREKLAALGRLDH